MPALFVESARHYEIRLRSISIRAMKFGDNFRNRSSVMRPLRVM